jgi:hypothetical protein
MARTNWKQKKLRSPNHSKKRARKDVEAVGLILRASLRSAAVEESIVSYHAS